MLREVAASVRLVVSLRAVAWAWSQPAVKAQIRRSHSLLYDLRDGKTSCMKSPNAARNKSVALAPTRSRPEVDKIRASSCSAQAFACASVSKMAVLRTPKRFTSARQELARFENEAIFKKASKKIKHNEQSRNKVKLTLLSMYI